MKTTYVSIECSNYEGKKCAPAQIVAKFSSRKSAELNSPRGMRIMTLKQAAKFLHRWNTEFENGNYNIF